VKYLGGAERRVQFAKVPRLKANELRMQLARADAVNEGVRIVDQGDQVLIPLTTNGVAEAQRIGLEIVASDPRTRIVARAPLPRIRVSVEVADELKDLLPKKWELIGDVLVIRLPARLEPFREEIARGYAEALNARTVCQEVGVIEGVHRTPKMRVIYGDGTETVHRENRILYKLDVTKVMFSSGNKHEKQRMAGLDCRGETVVDMFAGIGYFTLPIAKHAKAKRVIACEINPVAYRYLQENVALNHVESIVEPVLGDNRTLPGKGFADRVLMGYVGTTHEFLPKALELVKAGGIIHYHCTCPVDQFPTRPTAEIDSAAEGRAIEILRADEVKSYAPAISHYVIDFQVL